MANNRTGYNNNPRNNVRVAKQNFRLLTKSLTSYFWSAFAFLNMNYVAVATVLFVVLLSFVIPDISQRFHVAHELSDMKKVVNIVSQELSRAEAACMTVADEVFTLQCQVSQSFPSQQSRAIERCSSSVLTVPSSAHRTFLYKIRNFFKHPFTNNRNISHKELPIMSFFYTDSYAADEH